MSDLIDKIIETVYKDSLSVFNVYSQDFSRVQNIFWIKCGFYQFHCIECSSNFSLKRCYFFTDPLPDLRRKGRKGPLNGRRRPRTTALCQKNCDNMFSKKPLKHLVCQAQHHVRQYKFHPIQEPLLLFPMRVFSILGTIRHCKVKLKKNF